MSILIADIFALTALIFFGIRLIFYQQKDVQLLIIAGASLALMTIAFFLYTNPPQSYTWQNTTQTSTTSNVPLFCSGASILTTCGTTTESYTSQTNTLLINTPYKTNLLTSPYTYTEQVLGIFIFDFINLLFIFRDLIEWWDMRNAPFKPNFDNKRGRT